MDIEKFNELKYERNISLNILLKGFLFMALVYFNFVVIARTNK